MPESLLSLLKRLNAKERFFLVGKALGNESFRLCEEFRAELGNRIGQPVPADAFCAMDYHLDWIHAALMARQHGIGPQHSNADGLIQATQEDVDLLVAFERDGITHMILIEAKAATSWTNEQARHKAERLGKIFGGLADKWPGVRPHFVLMSPKSSRGLDTKEWPRWTVDADGNPLWIELPIPSDLLKVSRWDAPIDGKADKNGAYWKIIAR